MGRIFGLNVHHVSVFPKLFQHGFVYDIIDRLTIMKLNSRDADYSNRFLSRHHSEQRDRLDYGNG